jgi:hypothetical protein
LRHRNVYIDDRPPPEERRQFVTLTPGEAGPRMFRIELHNRGRTRRGTLTAIGWFRLVRAARRRWPEAVLSPRGQEPITIRQRSAGPVVVVCRPLPA